MDRKTGLCSDSGLLIAEAFYSGAPLAGQSGMSLSTPRSLAWPQSTAAFTKTACSGREIRRKINWSQTNTNTEGMKNHIVK